jgi:hypothetical protein
MCAESINYCLSLGQEVIRVIGAVNLRMPRPLWRGALRSPLYKSALATCDATRLPRGIRKLSASRCVAANVNTTGQARGIHRLFQFFINGAT